jgi:hypothetical protein
MSVAPEEPLAAASVPVVAGPDDHRHPALRAALPGLRTLRETWPAIVAVQVIGAIVVVSYFRVPAVTAACDRLADIKQAGGFALSALAMAIASGLLPEVAKFFTGVDRVLDRDRLQRTLLNMGIFAIVGVQCDALYRVLAQVFGDTPTASTILSKVAVDQFLFTPLLSLPTIALGYTWRDAGFRAAAVPGQLGVRWYLARIVPMLLTCWAYWIPMGLLMYALPAKLTFVYNAFASAASAILITGVAARHRKPVG